MKMEDPMIAFSVYTISALILYILADIARTNRAIWKEFREHRDRLTILETRCADNHMKHS